jgi:signal transduction histidine kinase
MSRGVPTAAIDWGWPVLAVRFCVCLMVLTTMLPATASGEPRGEPKRVLMLHSFGRDFLPWSEYARTIRLELEQQSPWPLDLQEHTLLSARFNNPGPMQRWSISEGNLPSESKILFREPGIWEKYSWRMSLIAAVILIQGVLISGLLHERRRRHLAEVESRQRLAELAHLNRYSAVGELTTSIAHELNQPLGSILTNAETAELMLKSSSPNLDEVIEILADIRRDDQRASEVICRLRSVLKKTPFEMGYIDLNETVRQAIGFVAAVAHKRNIAMKCSTISADLNVKGDAVQLQQVFLNLIINAMDAISETEAKAREISVTTSLSGTSAEVRIADTGPGIAAGDLKNVFDPFFTTKPQGMGMGLAIVRTIVEAHHGQISAVNQPSGGALFVIRLPIARGRAA